MTTEELRVKELQSYNILDTPAEAELNDLVSIASAILDTPISLISLVDDKRQWFKANIGLAATETERQHSFCQYALTTPNEVLVVEDALKDEKFKSNPLVLKDPSIRFYAGAPLVTGKGFVLGTLCIIDNKPRTISHSQKEALKLLAKKAINYIEMRKLLGTQQKEINRNIDQLSKLTQDVPGATFQLEVTPEGIYTISFVSKGITEIYPDINIKSVQINPKNALKQINPSYHKLIKSTLRESCFLLQPFEIEVKSQFSNPNRIWQLVKAVPEMHSDGTVVWYGTIRDITKEKAQSDVLNQVVYDISHVIRKPISSLQSLVQLIQTHKLVDNDAFKEYLDFMEIACCEADASIKELSETYSSVLPDTGLKAV